MKWKLAADWSYEIRIDITAEMEEPELEDLSYGFVLLGIALLSIIDIIVFLRTTRICFYGSERNGKKMSWLDYLICVFLSPVPVSVCGGLVQIYLVLSEEEGAGIWSGVWLGIATSVVPLLIQILCMLIYVKWVKPRNRSMAMIVYLCFILQMPSITYILDSSNLGFSLIVIGIYFALTLLFYRFLARAIAELTKTRQTVNMKAFVVLSILDVLFNIIMLQFFIVIWKSTDSMMSSLLPFVQSLKDSQPENYEDFLQVFKAMRQILVYQGHSFILPTIFLSAILMVAFYINVKNIKYMNEVVQAKEQTQQLSVEVMEALAHTIDAKDEYTKGHSTRVALYSKMIAQKMGMEEAQCERIYFMGLLHDIGKIGVPNSIINKPSKLTDEEYDIIKQHPAMGYEILAEIKSIPTLAMGARWHHERYDGKGYPDHKAGEEIPLEARIIAVADSYDAMTSNRSYRKYLPQEVVRGEIEKNIGTQFDEIPARCMLEIIDEDQDYVLHG